MARQQLFSPANAFIQGRAARQDYDLGQTRNALAQMELDAAPQQMAQRNRLADIGVEGAQQELDANKAKTAYATLKQALDSGNAKAFMLRDQAFLSNFQHQHGVDFASLTDEQATMELDHLARVMAGKAGIAPAQPKTPESFTLGAGQTRYGPNGQPIASAPVSNQMTPYQQERLAIERQKLNQPKADTGPLVQVSGEDGNPVYATREEAVGKPAYVARDKPAAADLKYQREVKAKIPRLKAAQRRISRLSAAIRGASEVKDAQGKVIQPAVKGISQNRFFDGGPLDAKALKYTKQGQEVDQAKASLLSELTALTRVPGIGSQSDLETRLASLPFPSTEVAPEVNERAISEIETFIQDLADAYGVVEGELAGGSSTLQPQQPQGGALQFASEAEAEAAGIKPGTRVTIGGVPGTWQ